MVGAGGIDGWAGTKPPIWTEVGYMVSVLVDERGFEDDEGLRKDKSVPALDFLRICGRDSCFKRYQQSSARNYGQIRTISSRLVPSLGQSSERV